MATLKVVATGGSAKGKLYPTGAGDSVSVEFPEGIEVSVEVGLRAMLDLSDPAALPSPFPEGSDDTSGEGGNGGGSDDK